MNIAREQRPRFRTDLVAQPIHEAGQRYVDVTDPDSGNTFRFYDVEYAIACAMDGLRDLHGLTEWAQEELGLEPSAEELQTVISTLGDLGYLEELSFGAPAEASPAAAASNDVELGLSGHNGAPASAAVPGGAAAVGGDVELGAPGKSPIARPRPAQPPAADVELGLAGGSGADAMVPATSGAAPAPASRGPAPAPSSDETSFEGLMDEGGGAPSPSAAVGGRESARELVMEFEAPTPPPADLPVPQASLRPRTQADSDEDGPTHLPKPQPHDFDEDEVSVDLSEHLSIGTEDVKEAVRQSKVMQAVAVPQELLDQLEAEEPKRAEPEPVAAPPTPVASATPIADEAAARAKEAVPAPVAPAAEGSGPTPTAKPVRKAKAPAAKPAPAVEPSPAAQAEPGGSSAGLIVLLVVLIVAVAGAAAWYYFTQMKPEQAGAGAGAGGAERPSAAQPEPRQAPPPPPSATAEAGEAKVVPAVAELDGRITWMEEDGASVDAGAVVAKLAGYEKHERQAQHNRSREASYQARLDKAQARLDKARADNDAALVKKHESDVAYAQDKVKQKQDLVAQHQAAMEKFFLKAPAAGTVKRLVQPDKAVKAGTEVVALEQPAVVTATFSGVVGRSQGDEVAVVAEGGGEPVRCEVTAAQHGTVVVQCPSDKVAEGARIVLVK